MEDHGDIENQVPVPLHVSGTPPGQAAAVSTGLSKTKGGAIAFGGLSFDLSHLGEDVRDFDWRCQDGTPTTFRVRIRYSNHCYSKTVATLAASDVVIDRTPLRIFCPQRHGESTMAVDMPASRISATFDNNWNAYRFYASPTAGRERFHMFFRLMPWSGDAVVAGVKFADLYVESAYRRKNDVLIKHHAPFGLAVERASK